MVRKMMNGMQVPYAAPALVQDDLTQMMAGAVHELQAARCLLSGGHSCLGPELALGFTVTGHVPSAAVMLKSGLRVGQKLVLTKALGVGLVLRAAMLQATRAPAVAAAWASMAQSNEEAAKLLRCVGVRGCTDITGFGLLGHAIEMARASEVCLPDLLETFWLPSATCSISSPPTGYHAACHTGGTFGDVDDDGVIEQGSV
jgi:selenide,water dikinase